MAEQRSEAAAWQLRPDAWRRLRDPSRWPGALLIYGIVGGLVCFWRLGATGLVSMEGMVVDGARRMLESGDWLVPRLYGELYTYKPALAYWFASLPLRLVEAPSEGLLRLPFAASGFLMGLAVLILIGRLAGVRAGLLCATASITGVLFLQKSRMMEFDATLTAGVGVAVAAACFNLSAERQRWSVWLLGYVALAGGFLTKGVPALMVFAPGILAAAFLGGRLRRLFQWRHLSAALLFVAITGSYLFAVWESAGAAAFEQPIVEARVRGFGKLSQEDLESLPEARRFSEPQADWRGDRLGSLAVAAVKPLSILAAFLPWSVLLFFMGPRFIGPRFMGRRSAGSVRGSDLAGRAAAGFLAAGALTFMVAPSHETRYFLPLAVPMGILCGLTADRLMPPDRPQSRRLIAVCAGLAVLIAVATVVLAVGLPSPPIPQAHRLALVFAGVAGAVAVLWLWRRRGRYRLPLVLGVACLCAMLSQYLGVDPYRAGKRNLRPQARALAPHLPAGETVWVLGPADEAGKHASLFFYLDRPIHAFRADGRLPPAAAFCLLTAQNLGRLERRAEFRFDEIARIEHTWFSYRLGSCSGA